MSHDYDEEVTYIEKNHGMQKAYEHIDMHFGGDEAYSYLIDQDMLSDDSLILFIEKLSEDNKLKEITVLLNQSNCSEVFDAVLRSASYWGHIEIVKYILNKSISQEALNDSLVSTSQNGHLDCALLLIKNGANTTYQESLALVLSCRNGFIDIATLLIGYGADKNKIDKINVYAWLYIIKKDPNDYLIESPEWLKPFIYAYISEQ
jgi:ankyrin repeat protein